MLQEFIQYVWNDPTGKLMISMIIGLPLGTYLFFVDEKRGKDKNGLDK